MAKRRGNGFEDADGEGGVAGGDRRERYKGQRGLRLGMKIYNSQRSPSPPPHPSPLSLWRQVLETPIISINTSHRVITQAPTFPPA